MVGALVRHISKRYGSCQIGTTMWLYGSKYMYQIEMNK